MMMNLEREAARKAEEGGQTRSKHFTNVSSVSSEARNKPVNVAGVFGYRTFQRVSSLRSEIFTGSVISHRIGSLVTHERLQALEQLSFQPHPPIPSLAITASSILSPAVSASITCWRRGNGDSE